MLCRTIRFYRSLPARRLGLLPRHRAGIPDDQKPPSVEKFISVSDVVQEARELGENFVFTDDSDAPVFKYEEAIFGEPEDGKEIMSQTPTKPVGSAALDVTSAYAPEQGFKEITVDVLKDKLRQNAFALLLDVRGPSEFASGHVPGARNVPLPELTGDYVNESDLKEYRDKAVAVICGIGKRSAQATVRMTKVLGFEDVTSVAAGTKEWIARGYEVEK